MSEPIRVFLASNFAEFKTERRLLTQELSKVETPELKVIDLGDKRAASASVEARSVSGARGAEVLVLLVGQEYGERRPVSYTELEYEAAVDAGDKIILAYVRDGGAEPEDASQADRERYRQLCDWKQRLTARHTFGTIEPEPKRAWAKEVARTLLHELYEWRIHRDPAKAELDETKEGAAAEGGEEWQQLLKELAYPLPELRNVRRSSRELLEDPNRARGDAYWNEAVLAWNEGLIGSATELFREAGHCRPRDSESHYWLARSLIQNRTFQNCREALVAAIRAARLEAAAVRPDENGGESDDGERSCRAAAAWLLAARAARRLGDSNAAADFAKNARQYAANNSRAHLEVAVQAAGAGDWGGAREAAREAFKASPTSFGMLEEDASVQQNHEEFRRRVVLPIRRAVRREVAAVEKAERDIAGLLGWGEPDVPEAERNASPAALVRRGRDMIESQLERLRRTATQLAFDARVRAYVPSEDNDQDLFNGRRRRQYLYAICVALVVAAAVGGFQVGGLQAIMWAVPGALLTAVLIGFLGIRLEGRRRRMRAARHFAQPELGPGWQTRLDNFERAVACFQGAACEGAAYLGSTSLEGDEAMPFSGLEGLGAATGEKICWGAYFAELPHSPPFLG